MAAAGDGHLARQGDDATRGPAVGFEHLATGGTAPSCREQRLERADDLAPKLASGLCQGGSDGPLQRTDVGPLRLHMEGQRDRDGDRLHGEPLPWRVIDTPSLRMGLTPYSAGQHRRLDANPPSR